MSNYYPHGLNLSKGQMQKLAEALNDFFSGLLIDRSNFRNLFGIIHFDPRNQDEDVKNNFVTFTFRYEKNGANNTNHTLNALVLHEKEIELYTNSGKLLIKA